MTLRTDFYFLSPVEVVRVSSNNLEEVAKWCGGRVATTESRRVPGRMDPYVWVPTPKGSKVSWAFPGMFITKRLVRTVQGDLVTTWAVFRRDYFEKNYFQTPNIAVEETWDKEKTDSKKAPIVSPSEPVSEPEVTTAIAELMDDESRERIEQINRGIIDQEILKVLERKRQDIPSAETMILTELHKTTPPGPISTEAEMIAEKVGQTPEFVQAVLDSPEGDLARAGKVVEEQLGGTVVEITLHPETDQIMTPGTDVVFSNKQPRQAEVHETVLEEKSGGGPVPQPPKEKPAELVEAWVHNHVVADDCDLHNCNIERYADGIQVFTDAAFKSSETGFKLIDMPAAVAERKS